MHGGMRMPPNLQPATCNFQRGRRHCGRASVLLATLVLLLVTPSPIQAQEEEKLATFFKSYLDARFILRPVEATELGDHRFDSQLEDLTPAARAKWLAQTRESADELPKRVNYSRLSRPGQIDFEMLQHYLKFQEWLTINFHPFEQDPRSYNEFIGDSVYLLLSQSSLPLETNVSNAIARMGQIPRVVAAARANLHKPFRTHTETAIRQNRGAIAFYENEIFQFAGQTRQLDALKSAAAPVVQALKDYQQFLEKEVLPQATDEWRIGTKKFSQKLELELDAGVTAEQVLADARNEFDRVEREMYVIARQLWSKYYSPQPIPADDEDGRRVTVQKVLEAVSKDHCQPQELLPEMKQRVEKLKKFITENRILDLPEPDHCTVVEMPEFKRGNSTAYMEAPAPLDPTGTGHLAISPPPKDWDAKKVNSYLEEYNNRMLDILTIHEGYPGHSVQLEFMNRNPSLIRKVLGSGVYIEGWAVYTEQMMVDQGYGQGDLGLRLCQLKFYLRAVANTILDHNMHCSNSSDEDALDFLVKRCYQSEGEARLKIIRAKQSSCQLSTYFTGRMAHYRLRQKMERQLGDKFDLARYHQAVLEPGAVPVKYLPELVGASLGLSRKAP